MTTIRAVRHPEVFKNSFYDQTEAPWIPTFNLSIATILIGMIDLGIPRTGVSAPLELYRLVYLLVLIHTGQPWFVITVEVLYYIYIFLGAMTGASYSFAKGMLT
jgi:hypothetical protein